MINKVLAALALSATCFQHAFAFTAPTLVGNFSVKNAAFTSMHTLQGVTSGTHMVVTAFTGNPFEKGAINIVHNITTFPRRGVRVTELSNNMTWPNVVTEVQPGQIGELPGLLVGDGFLVPGKSTGAIRFLALTGDWELAGWHTLTAPKGGELGGYFYHHALLRDMDGDGDLDILTARATKPLFGAEGAEMLWLEHPGANPFAGPWTEHSLASGPNSPGVFFDTHDFDGDGCMEIVYADFFGGPGFSMLSVPKSPGSRGLRGAAAAEQSFTTTTATDENSAASCWGSADNSTVVRTLIDPSIGTAFGLQLTDLNGDGQLDVLVTNHVNNDTLSGVYAYEPPSDAASLTDPSAWTRHDLYVGFKTIEQGIGQASPGRAAVFWPSISAQAAAAVPAAASGSVGAGAVPPLGSGKPSVSVAGDGAEGVYVLEPNSADAGDWGYTLHQVGTCAGTAGWQSIRYDAAGSARLYFPCYEKGLVLDFSYGQ